MTIKQLLIQCMADWYIRGESDQTRLSRILDIAHDLKVNSTMMFDNVVRSIWNELSRAC